MIAKGTGFCVRGNSAALLGNKPLRMVLSRLRWLEWFAEEGCFQAKGKCGRTAMLFGSGTQ
jgi:hypothetical protein